MKPNVLLIEDNEASRFGFVRYFSKDGYVVREAADLAEAARALAAKRFDAIIMDINLPGIDGLEATRRIRRSKADGTVPIIAITSFAMYGDRGKVLDAGCTAYFEKPIDPLTIVDRIHAVIGVKGE